MRVREPVQHTPLSPDLIHGWQPGGDRHGLVLVQPLDSDGTAVGKSAAKHGPKAALPNTIVLVEVLGGTGKIVKHECAKAVCFGGGHPLRSISSGASLGSSSSSLVLLLQLAAELVGGLLRFLACSPYLRFGCQARALGLGLGSSCSLALFFQLLGSALLCRSKLALVALTLLGPLTLDLLLSCLPGALGLSLGFLPGAPLVLKLLCSALLRLGKLALVALKLLLGGMSRTLRLG
jgi:hypothetical protein